MDLHALMDALLDIIYPPSLECIICGRRKGVVGATEICPDCYRALPFIHPPVCLKCGKPILEDQDLCPDCQGASHYFEQARSVFEYTSVIQKLIHRYKYRGEVSLCRPFAALMLEFLQSQDLKWDFEILVPVPLHPRRQKMRGFNQAEKIAVEISREIGKDIIKDQLIRKKDTLTQVNLDKHQRMWNLWDAFEVKQPRAIQGKRILLIDDVYTTGSTADQCSRVLLEAGAVRVYVLALATGRNIR